MRLSGEPFAPQLGMFGNAPSKEYSASEISANNIAKRDYQKEYMEYWNSTLEKTGTGRPVDALIMPLAPFAAARPGTYRYVGYSSIINLLDYTACVIPVTTVDKSLDLLDQDFTPLNDRDRFNAELCRCQTISHLFEAKLYEQMTRIYTMAHMSRCKWSVVDYRRKRFLHLQDILVVRSDRKEKNRNCRYV